MDRAPLTVVVLCYNEERNLPGCLAGVAEWAERIFVVDSGSTDGSRGIAVAHGAKVLEHPFEGHARQWNWALANLPAGTGWVLALDADHRVTHELRSEISAVLSNPSPSVDGYYVRRRQIFRGRWIKHGGYYPKYLLKLVRHGRAWSDEKELLDFRFYVAGRTERLRCDLIENNLNDSDLEFWLAKHVRFAALQAREELLRRRGGVEWAVRPSLWGSPDERTLFLKQVWYRMPLYTRPFLYFAYRYFLRLGFLDGREGLIFHFLQGLWYRLLVDIKLDELLAQETAGAG